MKSKRKLSPWLKSNVPPQKLAVGVGWYTEDDWAKVKADAVDADRFEVTYSEWVHMAEDSLSELRAKGIMAEKSYIKAGALLAWCLAHGRQNDGAARAEFVSEQVRRARKGGA